MARSVANAAGAARSRAHSVGSNIVQRIKTEWIANIGLAPSSFGTHSLRRTKAMLARVNLR
jgi:hypothetical protein